MSRGGLILAAPASGSGKTTITLGLLRALRNAGVDVAPAKVGPDYIDPGFHRAAAGLPCVNLDSWAMREATLSRLVARLTDSGLVLCEGVMGLFDGTDEIGTGSTAALAALTGWPVVLVIDARGLAASAAAIVHGFAHPPASLKRDGLAVAGVIFNRVGGARHLELLRASLREAAPEAAVLGGVPRATGIVLPERHLGLIPAGEQPGLDSIIDEAARLVAGSVDLETLCALARPARRGRDGDASPAVPPLGQKIAVARDDAFVFTYPALLEDWRTAGASLSFFAPLADEAPAGDTDAVYLPGGYPELHAGRLAGNTKFLDGLRDAADRSAIVYGECGGYMTLGRTLIDAEGRHHAMAGLLPLATSFQERRLHLGYREVTLPDDGPLGPRGTRYRGHEFHYATVIDEGAGAPLFAAADSAGRQLPVAGRRHGSTMGSFVHLIDRA